MKRPAALKCPPKNNIYFPHWQAPDQQTQMRFDSEVKLSYIF